MKAITLAEHLSHLFESHRLALARRIPPLPDAELDRLCADVSAALRRERVWGSNPVAWWQSLIGELPRNLWEHFLAGKDLLSGSTRVRVIAGTQLLTPQRRV